MYTVCYVGRLTDLLNYAYLFGGTVYVDTKRTCANRTLSGLCHTDVPQDQQQEEDQGGSGLIIAVIVVPVWV